MSLKNTQWYDFGIANYELIISFNKLIYFHHAENDLVKQLQRNYEQSSNNVTLKFCTFRN